MFESVFPVKKRCRRCLFGIYWPGNSGRPFSALRPPGRKDVEPLSVTAPPRARPRIFYGWWMLAITSLMAFFASGIFFRGFTVFVPAIRDSLGISQAQTNLIFALARAEGGLEGPFAGWLIDRFGNRALLIPAVLLAVAGYLVLFRLDLLAGVHRRVLGLYPGLSADGVPWATASPFSTLCSPASISGSAAAVPWPYPFWRRWPPWAAWLSCRR